AVAVRKLHVEEHGVRRLGGDRGEGLCRIGCFAGDDVAGAFQQLSRDGAKRLVIVDDQDALSHRFNRRTRFRSRLRVFPGIARLRWNPRGGRWMMGRMHNRFRLAVVVAAVGAARVGERLIASVKPVGDSGFGPRRLVALDWNTGDVLPLGESHFNDTDARAFDGPVDHVVQAGNAVWALEVRPGRLLRLDPSTLAQVFPPIRLSSGRTLGLAAGGGYLWVTAADAGEVLRIDPATGAITRAHVGGFPVGVVVANGKIWFADRSGGKVVRLDP